jgi:hypothetical protein
MFIPETNMSDIDKALRNVYYKLYGVLVHSGNSSHSGHYSFVRGPNDFWFLADDKCIHPVQPSDALRQNAYILFYKKISSDRGSKGNFGEGTAYGDGEVNGDKRFEGDDGNNGDKGQTGFISNIGSKDNFGKGTADGDGDCEDNGDKRFEGDDGNNGDKGQTGFISNIVSKDNFGKGTADGDGDGEVNGDKRFSGYDKYYGDEELKSCHLKEVILKFFNEIHVKILQK